MFSWLRRLFSNQPPPTRYEPPPPGLSQITADASRCVQCGLCGYNCPVGINVRAYARRGDNVTDPRCISCGACVAHCPRGTLRWGTAVLIRDDNTLQVNPDAFVMPLSTFERQAQS